MNDTKATKWLGANSVMQVQILPRSTLLTYMTNETPTPRTDAEMTETENQFGGWDYEISVDFARTLEREVQKLTASIEEFEVLVDQKNHLLADAEYSKQKLTAELTALREDNGKHARISGLEEAASILRDQMTLSLAENALENRIREVMEGTLS